MSGASKCKNFILNLNVDELKAIKVSVKRLDVPETDSVQQISRRLDDPKSLVVHFKKKNEEEYFQFLHKQIQENIQRHSRAMFLQPRKGIFDRKDVVVNEHFTEKETIRKKSRSRSITSDRHRNRSRSIDKKYKETYKKYKSERSRSRSEDRKKSPRYRRDRSRSSSYRRRSITPSKYSQSKRRSLSKSPTSKPIKKPGLYIPPKSDYLRYEKKKRSSRSTSPSTSRKKSPSPKEYKRKSRSRSYERRKSPRYVERRKRNSRSLSPKERRNRSRSPSRNDYHRSSRYRSPNRHHEREVENRERFGMSPFLFQDGEYWLPAGSFFQPGYDPREFIPPPILYPRGFPHPMLMPRMPMRMPPPRMRRYTPRMQQCPSTSTSSNEVNEPYQGEKSDKDSSSVVISEICIEKEDKKTD